MKLFSKIAALSVGLAMAVGVGVAVGSKKVSVAHAGADTGNIAMSSSPDKSTVNGTQVGTVRLNTSLDLQVSVNTTGNNGKWYSSGTEWRLYQNNNPQMVLSIGDDYYLDAVTFTYSVSNTGVLTYGSAQKTSGTKIELPGNTSSETFGVGNTGSATNGQVRLTAVQVWYSEAGSSTKQSSSVTIKTGKPLQLDVNGSSSQLSVETSPANLSLSYESNNESVATVSSTGLVTPHDAGTATITVAFAGNDDYYASSDTITVNVVASEPAHITGKTISQIVSEITSAGTSTPVAIYEISGYVTSWDGTNTDGTQFGNFYIADVAGDKTNQAYVYGANYGNSPVWNGAKYTFSNNRTFLTNEVTSQIKIGTKVSANFMAWMYNGTKFEFQGEITSVGEQDDPLASIALSGTYPTEFYVGDDFSSEGLTVTATYESGNSHDVTPTSVSSPDMSSAGQKTVTVTYTENEVSKTASYEITVKTVVWHTITFLPGEGSGDSYTEQAKEGSDYTLPTTTSFTHSGGKVLDYWEINGVKQIVIENIAADYEATAIWKDAPETTTVSAMFGSDKSTSSNEVTNGEKYKTDYGYTINSNLSFDSISKVYPQENKALKFGSSSSVGTMTVKVNVENAVIVSVTVNAYRYHETKGTTLTIGGIEKELTTEAADYVADVSSAQSDSVVISALESSTDKRFFVVSITIEYSTSGVTPVPTTYTVTYDSNGGSGTMTDPSSPYSSGSTVTTLNNEFTKENYHFVSWNTSSDGKGTSYDEGGTFTISANTTLYAMWEENGGGGGSVSARYYKLVESTDDLVDGAKYLITCAADHDNGFYAMSTNQKTSNRGAASVESSGANACVSTSDVEVITLGGAEGAWTLSTSTGYLYAASSSGNQLKTRTDNSDKNSEWAITFEDSVASIVAQGSNTRNTMQYNYNNGSPLFACYGSASQSAISLYRLSFEETLLGNITCDGNGSYTIKEGFTWSELKSVYQALPLIEQTDLETADNAGLIRYDYLIAKYGEEVFENFIGRTITPLPNAAYIAGYQSSIDSSSSITIIVIVAVTSMTLLGVTLVLRKRKHQ